MTISQRMADDLDALALSVVKNYHHARRQLEAWTGEYPASTIGAAPSTSRSEPSDDVTVPLTTVERQAISHDLAANTLAMMTQRLADMADTGRATWADIDGVAMPTPADTDAAHMAVMMWTVRRCVRDRHAVTLGRLGPFVGNLRWLEATCRIHLPPPATIIVDCCHAHAAAKLESEVDGRFRRHHLCGWCGKFRALHGVNPPPELVRLHDRGIKMSATILRRAGVKVA